MGHPATTKYEDSGFARMTTYNDNEKNQFLYRLSATAGGAAATHAAVAGAGAGHDGAAGGAGGCIAHVEHALHGVGGMVEAAVLSLVGRSRSLRCSTPASKLAGAPGCAAG